MRRGKRGLSPVVTTVLLIALVVVTVSIVFLWFRGMVQEGVTKFGKNIELVCDDVQFDAEYSSGRLDIVNTGNTPIYTLNLKIQENGNYQTTEITELSSGTSWPETGLASGGAFTGDISSYVSDSDKLIIIPVLIGESSSGQKTFICEGKYGKEIEI